MKDLGDNSFGTDPNESITIKVSVDKRPYLCKFQDPPTGSKWDPPPKRPSDISEVRFFKMPGTGQVKFAAGFDSAIGADDPNPQATYKLEFTGSAPGSESPTRTVVVPKDDGPIPVEYSFTVRPN
jgi:hypothetical protein